MAKPKPFIHPKSKDYIDIRMHAKKGWTYKPKLFNHKIFRLSIWAEFMKLSSLQHRQYQKLTLKLRSRKLEDEDLWQIGRALKSSKHLGIMLVGLRMSDEFTNLGLKYLSKKFAFIKKLEVVSLCLKKCYCIQDEGVIFLAKNVSRIKSLKSLNFDLEFIPKVSDQCMVDISNCLKRLPQLKNFQINLHQSSVTTLGASCLIYSISHLKHLQSITLDFSRCNLEDEIFPILAHTISESQQLQNFHLFCNYVDELTGRGLVSLCESIANLQTIKDFQLYFYNCDKISTENLCEMANILKMQELAKLRLSFYGADFIDLFDLVAYLPNLVELFLVLNSWQCRGEPTIPKGFLSASHNLKKLYITFENCFEVADRHAAILADEISPLSHLNLLHITFFGCDITREGMIIFMKCLSELTNLEDLRLYLERRVISKGLLSNLASYLTQMKHMSALNLTFFCASFMDDEDIVSLANALSHMKELSLLLITLTGCKELTDEGIKYLVSSLSTLKNLRGLKMDLRGLPELTFEGLDSIIELFGGFSSLIKGRVFFNGNYITPRILEKLTIVTRSLPKLVCFSLNHQNISSYHYNSSQLFPEYWFTPTF